MPHKQYLSYSLPTVPRRCPADMPACKCRRCGRKLWTKLWTAHYPCSSPLVGSLVSLFVGSLTPLSVRPDLLHGDLAEESLWIFPSSTIVRDCSFTARTEASFGNSRSMSRSTGIISWKDWCRTPDIATRTGSIFSSLLEGCNQLLHMDLWPQHFSCSLFSSIVYRFQRVVSRASYPSEDWCLVHLL